MKSLTFISACALGVFLEFFSILNPALAQTRPENDGNWKTLVKTLETPSESLGTFHYEIHFAPKDEAYAKRVVEILEEKAPKIFSYFDYVPEWTVHFNILEASVANGSATIFPTNIVNLYHFPPAGREHLQAIGDWVEGLVVHELVHIAHMEQTRGVIAGLENIFGSLMRFGGVVPRWFTEGIAVWAEGRFATRGRLASRQIRLEMEGRLLDPNFCREIDCLDSPGSYPYGQTSYWLGAYFLKSLEEKNPGTLRCLIVENSDNIPFLLNHAFKKCAGNHVDNLFRMFRREYVKRLKKERKEFLDSKAQEDLKRFSLPHIGEHGRDPGSGVPLWSAGRFIEKGKFYYILTRDESHKLVEVDLKSGKTRRQTLKDNAIHLATPSSFSREQGEFLASFSGFDVLGQQRSWFVYSAESLKRQKALPFLEDALEAFQLSEDTYLGVFFENRQWLLKHFDRGGKKTREKVLKTWPRLAKLSDLNLKKENGKHSLFYQLHWPWADGEHHRYQFHRLTWKKNPGAQVNRLYTSKEPFRYFGQCGGEHLFHQDQTLTLVRERGNVEELSYEGIQQKLPWSGEIADLIFRKGEMVALASPDPISLYRLNMNCGEIISELTSEVVKKRVAPAKVSLDDSAKEIEEGESLDDYPNWDHFLPHYWLFGFGRSTNLSFLSISTQLHDPLRSHIVDLSLHRYSTSQIGSELGGDVRYTYNWHEHRFSLGHSKRYFQSSFIKDELDREESTYSSYRYLWDLGRHWVAAPHLQFSRSRQLDFLSRRKSIQATAGISLMNIPTYPHSFFQGGEFTARSLRFDVKNREKFWGETFRASQNMRITRQLGLSAMASYAHLRNDDLSSGTLYGGGYSSAGGSVSYPFYGLEYSDLYGRELTTGGLQSQYTITRPREAATGAAFFPLYLKKIQGLLGVQVAHSEFAFLKSTQSTYKSELLRGEHIGLRVKSVLWYSTPADIDFIYARVHDPNGGAKQKQWILTINAGLLP